MQQRIQFKVTPYEERESPHLEEVEVLDVDPEDQTSCPVWNSVGPVQQRLKLCVRKATYVTKPILTQLMMFFSLNWPKSVLGPNFIQLQLKSCDENGKHHMMKVH